MGYFSLSRVYNLAKMAKNDPFSQIYSYTSKTPLFRSLASNNCSMPNMPKLTYSVNSHTRMSRIRAERESCVRLKNEELMISSAGNKFPLLSHFDSKVSNHSIIDSCRFGLMIIYICNDERMLFPSQPS